MYFLDLRLETERNRKKNYLGLFFDMIKTSRPNGSLLCSLLLPLLTPLWFSHLTTIISGPNESLLYKKIQEGPSTSTFFFQTRHQLTCSKLSGQGQYLIRLRQNSKKDTR